MFQPIDQDLLSTQLDALTDEGLKDFLDVGVMDPLLCADVLRLVSPFFTFLRTTSLTGDRFWTAFRGYFGFAQDPEGRPRREPFLIPMNAANLCPEPAPLLQAANLLRLHYNNNVAQQTRTRRGQRVLQMERVRELVAAGVGIDKANASNIALLRNSSEGNNAIANGYNGWIQGDAAVRDNVVLWAENHPTNLESWRLRAEFGEADRFDIRLVSWELGDDDDAILKAFTSKIDGGTRFVSYTDTSNGSGTRVPDAVVKGIWDHVQANKLDCHVHIDGTMAWGVRAVNLAQPYCHSFVSSAHKWFMGPKETALFYMCPEQARRFSPRVLGYDYRIVAEPWRKMPDNAMRFELIGQRDDVNLITLGLTQMMWTVLQLRHDPFTRVSDLARELKTALELTPKRWTLVTPSEEERSRGVVRVTVKAPPHGRRAGDLYDWIYKDPRYLIGGSGDDDSNTFRLCPHLYNTEADVRRAVIGMNAWWTQRA